MSPTPRTIVATLGVPAGVLAVAWILRAWWSARLPDPLAVHWQHHSTGDVVSQQGLSVTVTAVSTFLAMLGCVLAIVAGRRGLPLGRDGIGFIVGFAVLPASLLIGTLVTNLDAVDWRAAAGSPWPGLVALLAALPAGGLAALIVGPAPFHRVDCPVPGQPSVGLTAGQRAMWVGGTKSGVALGAIAAVAVVLPVIWLLFGSRETLIGQLVVLIGCLLAGLTLTSIRVRVDAAGVMIRVGLLGWPRRFVALNRIARAETAMLSVFGNGGLGVRLNPVARTSAYKLRGGPALVLRLHGGRRVLISVDDPQPAAGLVNDFLRSRPPHQ